MPARMSTLCHGFTTWLWLLCTAAAVPWAARGDAATRVADHPANISVNGSILREQGAGLRAGRALALALSRISTTKQNVTLRIEGYFVLERPIEICGRTRFSLISPRRTAVLAAASANVSRGVSACGTDQLLLSGFQLEGFNTDGIFAKDTKATEVRGITVLNTRSTGWSQAAIHLTGNSTGAYIHHNSVRYADYAGILIDTTSVSDVSNVRITYNRVLDTCRLIDDCGAIYINDRARRSSDITIRANHVENFGPVNAGGRGIYLDDWASHVVVLANSISGTGRYAVQIHGGHDNAIESNVVDARSIATVMLYQAGLNDTFSNMTNNVFSGNTIHVSKRNSVIIPIINRTGNGALSVFSNIVCVSSTCGASQ